MFKKFTEGLVFGSGFAISFVVVWYIAAYFIYPMFVNSKIEQLSSRHLQDYSTDNKQSIRKGADTLIKPDVPFHELDLEEKIKSSSVIALARYEPSSDGKIKAIIKEFLKMEPGVTIYYKVGDEHPSSSYEPKEKTYYGDGVIIFFTGSPAMMRYSTTFRGNRIQGLSDLPIELLRKKCKKDNA